MKRKGVVYRIKHGDTCPACHSMFEISEQSAGPEHTTQSERTPLHSHHHFSMPLPFKTNSATSHSFPFTSSRKKSSATPPVLNMTSASSCDSQAETDIQSKSRKGSAETEDDGIMTSEDDVCTDNSPCPFAFIYETEEVEEYQLAYEDNSEIVESYQLGWLLST